MFGCTFTRSGVTNNMKSNYGFDVNGREIVESSISNCQYCGGRISTQLSDGSVMSGSCGCDGLEKALNKKTNYIITKENDYDCDVLYVIGLENAIDKYEEMSKRALGMEVITLAKVMRTNL